MVELEKGDWE